MPSFFRGTSGSTKVQRAVSGIKILLDVAKESSDALPPLKSALGGINALIKHYEQYKDVKEKIEQLVPWLKKLKDNLTIAADGIDLEEEERRKELSSSLEEIGKRSQALLEKKKVAGFLDKSKDAQEVVNLIEQLRTAIVYYQFSQQQTIYNRVGKLASSLDTTLNLREKSPLTKEKLDNAFARLDRLGLGKDGENVADARGSLRRADLLTTLDRIKRKLQEILGRVEAPGYVKNDEDFQIASELMDDIRDAVTDYQTACQQIIYDQNLKLIVSLTSKRLLAKYLTILQDGAELLVLNSCRRAYGAGYRHGNRNGCLRGTREGVLDEIERWTEDPEKAPVFWLNGLAGTGKSTIAQTTAERLFADGRLGASFFCSRGVEERSDLQLIFPTLAFQLAQQYPEFRSSLIPLLQSNPDIIHESLQDQMEKFLVEPLRSADISTVIVIDALDECKDEDPESAILLVVGQSVSDIPGVKFFITSRPEMHITTGFRGPLLDGLTDVFVLHDIEPRTINNDIRRFFDHELSRLAHRRGGIKDWPTQEQLDELCRRAGGLFVYAVATVNFLEHKLKRPSDRLDELMKSPESTACEGKAKLKAYTSLDSLYTSIIQSAFVENDIDDDATVRSVLSAVVLISNPLSPSAIATLMGFDDEYVWLLLESIQSLLLLPEDPGCPVQAFHKSFPDFITDRTRCADPRFYISSNYHTELALRCLGHMDNLLEKNMCLIPDYALNSEVKDLPKKIAESGIPGAMEYSCRSWYKHLTVTNHPSPDALSALRNFLEKKFIFWLEVLSVLGAMGDAARALISTTRWLDEIRASVDAGTLLDTATDCLRFVTEFFEVIGQSAPHIYHSALQLVPRSSVVWKLYGRQSHSPRSRVIFGIPTSWDACVASVGAASAVDAAAWSPCGQFVALGSKNAVEIRDSNTLEILSVLKLPHMRFAPQLLLFSPDGRLLSCYSQGAGTFDRPRLLVWDIQTGAVISNIGNPSIVEIGFFDNRRIVNLLNNFFGGYSFCMYIAPAGTRLCDEGLVQLPDHQLGAHWSHGNTVRLATSSITNDGCLIEIHEIQPTSGSSLLPVESFPIPYKYGWFSFSPVSFHASFLAETEVVVLDARTSKPLLETRVARADLSSPAWFSPDGRFFAYGSSMYEICVWQNTATGYVSWGNFRSRLPFREFSPSPTASSMLTWGQAGVQLLHRDDRPSSPGGGIFHREHLDHLVAYSTNRMHVAMTRLGDNVVVILDTPSTTLRQPIETDSAILALKILGDTIVVLHGYTLTRWDLETGGRVHGPNSTVAVRLDNGSQFILSHDCSLVASAELDLSGQMMVARLRSVEPPKTIASFGSNLLGVVVDIQFSPDGREVWLLERNTYTSGVPYITRRKWEVAKECVDERKAIAVYHSDEEKKGIAEDLPAAGWSWADLFSCGYHIKKGVRWVEDSKGNKLLWLPPNWRSADGLGVRWDGNFLALVAGHHAEPVIVEFRSS